MQLFTRRCLSLFVLWSIYSVSAYATSTTPVFDEEVIKERLDTLSDGVVAPKYVTAVKGYLKGYLVRNRKNSERILGRTVLYFPIFEHYLKEHGLPDDLKYLAVVESALKPRATSRVGAGGLWQFMPATGRSMGLDINSQVDERWDPHKSTEAAMRYLNKQYKRFDDWALALAAYNSGSGRVRRAIKRGRSKNFWRIQRFLPRETRNYVPAFIAANYMLNYYEEHGLVPEYPDLDIQITETIKIYNSISFYRVAQLTELPLEIIETLNPSYKRGRVPTHAEGHYLTLPKRVMPAVKDFLEAQRPDGAFDSHVFSSPVFVEAPAKRFTNAKYIKSIYIVRGGQTLTSIAKEVGVSVQQLKMWNTLRTSDIQAGQELILYFPKSFKRFRPIKPIAIMEEIPDVPLEELEHIGLRNPSLIHVGRRFEYYYVTRKEKPSAIANRIPGLNYSKLMLLNGWQKDRPLKPGTLVKVRRVGSESDD
ncbi:MAG: transglycosylase SLT domain-containing protein [Saprospiraceae bacterium]|nr:transglycosylase SLT domain-containing protein [Saprospiraceae bacterium]